MHPSRYDRTVGQCYTFNHFEKRTRNFTIKDGAWNGLIEVVETSVKVFTQQTCSFGVESMEFPSKIDCSSLVQICEKCYILRVSYECTLVQCFCKSKFFKFVSHYMCKYKRFLKIFQILESIPGTRTRIPSFHRNTTLIWFQLWGCTLRSTSQTTGHWQQPLGYLFSFTILIPNL